MILVQNLRQQLSGSSGRILIFFLLIITFISFYACKARKITKEQENLTYAFDKYKNVKDKANHYAEDTSKVMDYDDSLDLLYPVILKEEYTIAYLLPFILQDLPLGLEDQSRISQIAQEFYMGAAMAIEGPCRNLKSDFIIHVFDTENRQNKIKTEIFSKLNDHDIDLIIGPFVADYVKIISSYSNDKHVNVFSPLVNIDTCLKENPYFISPKPSDYIHLEFVSKYIYKHYKDHNVIFIGSDEKKNKQYLNYMKNFIDTSVFLRITDATVNITTWKSAPYMPFLNKEKNVLLIPIDDEILVNSIITNLIAEENGITIFAPSAWLNYRSVDIEYLQTLNTHFLIDSYIDYYDPLIIKFIKDYRRKYKTEPSKYSFKGYDYTLFTTRMLSRHGKYFQREKLTDTNYVHTRFDFKNVNNNKGWENTNIQLIKFDNYILKEIED